jgi:TRAP transporter TAXI family solute receptor
MAATVADTVKKKFPEIDIQVEPGAGLVNMEKIITDKADLGWSMTSLLSEARSGKGRWKDRRTDKLLYVASFYPNVWHLAVPADSGITKLADLRGKPVALPQRATISMEHGWELLLSLHGMTLADLGAKSYGSFTDNVELVKNRQAVAMGWLVTVPAPFMLDLGAAQRVQLVGVPEDILERLRKLNTGLVRHVIPKGTYAAQGIQEDVVTYQTPLVLVGSPNAPAEVIYKATKAIVEGRENFVNVTSAMKGVSAKDMAQDFGVPYHPGAEKYYREVGLLK